MTDTVIPFLASHIALLSDDAALLAAAPDMAGKGVGWTLVRDGRVLGCGGALAMWDGVAEAWVVVRADATEGERRTLARYLRRGAPRMVRDLGLRRLQATVVVAHDRGRQLAEWMGMRPEGMMLRYGPDKDGSDHVRYAWTAPREVAA